MVSKLIQLIAVMSLILVQGVFEPDVYGAKKKSSGPKMYRYVDENGVTVTSSTLPPQYAQKGYEVISVTTGLVIETVARRKTEEELEQERLEAEQKAEEERLRREQERLDMILLNSYTDIADIERALENELDASDQKILILRNNINRFTRLLVDKQTLAARNERLGKALSPKLMKEIDSFKKRIVRQRNEIGAVEEQKVLTTAQYNSSMIRFSELKAQERIKQFRESKEADKTKQAIFDCRGENACDNAWTAALRFATEYSTVELSWANESTIMMRKPQKNKDVSLVITRVNNSRGDAASMVLEVRCNKSPVGDEFCESPEVDSIRNGFASYLGAGPASSP